MINVVYTNKILLSLSLPFVVILWWVLSKIYYFPDMINLFIDLLVTIIFMNNCLYRQIYLINNNIENDDKAWQTMEGVLKESLFVSDNNKT